MSYGFSMTEGDHCIYTKIIGGNFVLLTLYVDDILIASNDKSKLAKVKTWLSSKFDMKDMGKPPMFWEWKYIEIGINNFLVCPKRLTLEA